ncbi:Phosphatidylinositol 3,4,5-trisphosphate 3-phosphatase and dual-specificity protein phosphatase PTEN [Hypsibius exemplaris]|uniref:Phosphatidylinositol 3,4,5-trisphosphate 3-phosphatase and dual-specificity protein phosphatase PTEN n=1 Tax=Hypsibius exemplaris TaxID=2072580 RepID=A0A9X6NL59_HYPEX|nr:Phosphatidylinositol 3,4,5-trisphosphate 3-phosphatase and dual-specificity protein phosphatase PTEN [Hypsibius exemplaris]
MTLALRRLVSQNRRRYNEDGFDLDLTYILPNLIAMGFPADNYERFYRNSIGEVTRFFEAKHANHYRIYNLCSERTYDFSRFRFNVVVYPFEDHQPPSIELIKACCSDLDNWLGLHSENVAAIHCKAGKGRTGLIICSYLLHSKRVRTPSEALEFYGSARTVDSLGVTIPSQQRYINYYYHLLRTGVQYCNKSLIFHRLQVMHGPSSSGEEYPCSSLTFSVLQFKSVVWSSNVVPLRASVAENATIHTETPVTVTADVLVECHGMPSTFLSPLAGFFPRKEKLFQFWFNTFFVEHEADDVCASSSDDDGLIAWSIPSDRFDVSTKDRGMRNFPPNFRVRLWFRLPDQDGR